MKKIRIGCGLAALLTLGTVQADEPTLRCWDGSFAYNTITLNEHEERWEVTIKGSEIGPLRLENIYNVIDFGGRWDNQQRPIYIAFEKDQCTVDAEAKTFSCEREVSPHSTTREVALYVGQFIKDITEVHETILPMLARRISVTFNVDDGITMDVVEGTYDPDLEVQTLSVTNHGIPFDCETNVNFETEFPQRLRTFLSNQ